MHEELFMRFKDALAKTLERFREKAATIRTGRPTPALIEDVPVECYGATMTLKEVATILVQPPNVLVIQPWDKANLQAIEKALLKAGFGASPVVDGEVVRVALPPLTQERRNELVKMLRRHAEEARIASRLLRDEARKTLHALASDKKISEDEKFRGDERLQETFDEFQKKLGAFVEEREKEIMTV